MNTNTHGGETVAGGTKDGGRRRRSLWKSPALVTALILPIPLLGNHFVDGWNWDFHGFVLAGAFVFGTGLTYELVTKNADRIAYRAAVGVALAAAFVLVWMNFVQVADDVNPAAVMYFGVPIVGIIGATIWTPGVLRGFGLNAFFVMVFFGSALLFRKAARAESVPGSV